MILYIILGIIALIAILGLTYFFLLIKTARMPKKVFRYKEESDIKNTNVLIIYQPSRHKTTKKITDIIINEISNKGYGYKLVTLDDRAHDYKSYKYVFFVAPVYFGEVHYLFSKLGKSKIDNLIIIYNGLNKDSFGEDEKIKAQIGARYSKIKVHTSDIELVKEFVNKEVK